MDKLSSKLLKNMLIIMLIQIVVTVLLYGKLLSTTNGFIIFPYFMTIYYIGAGDLVAETLIKKNTLLLIVDGETKSSIHDWVKKSLRKLFFYGLLLVTLALLILHFVVRPLNGYVISLDDIPWVMIVMCILYMFLLSYIIYGFSEAIVLRQLRLNRYKTYFIYLGFFYSILNDMNLERLDQIIIVYVLFGIALILLSSRFKSREIDRFYEEDLV